MRHKTYRFRCFDLLKKRAARVASERGSGDASDVARQGVIEHVERWEKKLGLPPEAVLDHKLRLALKRKCKERGYPYSKRLLEVAKLIAPAFQRTETRRA